MNAKSIARIEKFIPVVILITFLTCLSVLQNEKISKIPNLLSGADYVNRGRTHQKNQIYCYDYMRRNIEDIYILVRIPKEMVIFFSLLVQISHFANFDIIVNPISQIYNYC